MTLDFPANTSAPYVDPVSGLKYIYNDSVGAWEAAIQPPAIVSEVAPSINIPGFLWWDSTNGSLYVYYTDADSEQWVEAAPTGASSSIARISRTAPENPAVGELWWDNENGNLYIYYQDADSSQWIQATNYNTAVPTTGTGVVITSGTTAPTQGKLHDLWYNTTDKTLYINHKTGESHNWVKAHNVSDTTAITSITATAPLVATAGTTPTLSINAATTTTSGVVTVAAVADSNNKSQNHVLTPKVLSESISSYLQDSTPSQKGIISLATHTEVIDGVIGNKAISPLTLKQAMGAVSNVPVGGIIQSGSTNVPSGYLKCDGALVSRTTYATLFQTIGTTYGIGDGVTTFKLPEITGTPMSIIKV